MYCRREGVNRSPTTPESLDEKRCVKSPVEKGMEYLSIGSFEPRHALKPLKSLIFESSVSIVCSR